MFRLRVYLRCASGSVAIRLCQFNWYIYWYDFVVIQTFAIAVNISCERSVKWAAKAQDNGIMLELATNCNWLDIFVSFRKLLIYDLLSLDYRIIRLPYLVKWVSDRSAHIGRCCSNENEEKKWRNKLNRLNRNSFSETFPGESLWCWRAELAEASHPANGVWGQISCVGFRLAR